MSRTAFAVTFKERVGLSPMDYLTRWRIIQAADRLTSTRQSLAEIGWRSVMSPKSPSARPSSGR